MNAEFEIQLRDVIFYARHGVMKEENVLGNQYRVNVRLRIDASSADLNSDCINSTVSYADVFEVLKSVMSETKALLETVALNFANRVKDKWPNVKSGEIEIVKVVPPIPDMIGQAGVCYRF